MLPYPIEADRLSHTYPGGVAALKPTSLQVQTGEVLGVVGQNGSGKTTLVKHFNGLLRPTSGRLLIAGADTAGRPVCATKVVVSIQQLGTDPDVVVPTGPQPVLSLSFQSVGGAVYGPSQLLFVNTEATGASAAITFTSSLALSYQ